MLAPKTDGRRVPRVDLDWETCKVLSEQTSTIDGIAGWHCSDRNDLMSLTRWASLLSASSSSLRNGRSMSAWASRGTSYIIRTAFLWMTSSFFRCVFAAEEKIEEQYSLCDLIRAVYNTFNRSLERYGVALASIPRSPWHLLTTLSIYRRWDVMLVQGNSKQLDCFFRSNDLGDYWEIACKPSLRN